MNIGKGSETISVVRPPALGHPDSEAAIEPNELKSKVVLNGCKSIRNNGGGS